jgi:hypothetical protein
MVDSPARASEWRSIFRWAAASRAPGRVLCIAAVLLSGPRAEPADPQFVVGPGPAFIAEAEKAVLAGPAGQPAAVILLDEGEVRDIVEPGGKSIIPLLLVTIVRTVPPAVTGSVSAHHRRVKILSGEGRSAADIEIRFADGLETIEGFWGRTLLPDGTVRELGQGDLHEQTVFESGGLALKALKGALPGVVPGCVIDYGFLVRRSGAAWLRRLAVQRPWPILEYRHRWATSLSGASILKRGTEGLSFEARKLGKGFLFTGRDLPPAVEEPLMPPAEEVLASVTLYYQTVPGATGRYWDTVAESIRGAVREFTASRRANRKVAGALGAPREGDLHERLAVAYDWIEANVHNLSLPGPDGTAGGRGARAPETLRDVVEQGRGESHQLAFLFSAIAQDLGARATLVLVPDRRERSFERRLLDAGQLEGVLVAIGSTRGSRERFVAPGWGLPYGEIPWWFEGTEGLRVMADRSGTARTVRAPAEASVCETDARLTLQGDPPSIGARWTRTGAGHDGLVERLGLQGLAAGARERRLVEICAAGQPVEVRHARDPSPDAPDGRFRIECEARMDPEIAVSDPETIGVGIEGPWIHPVPILESPTRMHKVVMDFARVDRARIVVEAPPGYIPRSPPPPVIGASPYGSYSLVVECAPGGCEVLREFALAQAEVAPHEYEALRSFLIDARRADRTRIAFARGDVRVP